MPSLVVIAGPNGSGKSTLRRIREFGEVEAIDPDAIARSMPQDVKYGKDVAAAREALKRRDAAIAARRSFLVESTLSGRDVHRLMEKVRSADYRTLLHFVCVESPDQAVERVRNRVARGGHDVPEQNIRRRFSLSLANLPLAIALSNESYLYDNSDVGAPHRRVAIVRGKRSRTVKRCPEWATSAVSAAASIRQEMDRSTSRGQGQSF